MMTSAQEQTAALYESVYLIRQCENKICEEYASDLMKTPVHLCIGAEAIHAGVLAGLPTGTQIFGTYRNHGLYLAQTGDTDGFFAELFGKASGCAGGRAGSMHLTAPEKGLMLTSAVVATTIPVAVGAALAHAYRGSSAPVAVFFGDGAFEEGAFWESINFACLQRLRVLFVCEDNGLAIHTPSSARQGFRSIPEVIQAFRCHSASVEGWDASEVLRVSAGLIQTMNDPQDAMPAFLYAPYFRFYEHVGIHEDFHAGYRIRPDEKDLKRKDPLLQTERQAAEAGVPAAALEEIRRKVDERIRRSVEKAKAAPFPSAESLFDVSG